MEQVVQSQCYRAAEVGRDYGSNADEMFADALVRAKKMDSGCNAIMLHYHNQHKYNITFQSRKGLLCSEFHSVLR